VKGTAPALVGAVLAPHVLGLRVAGVPLEVVTNEADVWAALGRYYEPWLAPVTAPAARVRLIQGALEARGPFTDLVRADGKRVKEAVQDVAGGRLILKRATGVVMGLWPGHAFAVGDLRANLNQVINLVNACYAKVVLGRGHVLLHAAGVSRDGRAVVLAGLPGAGKSSAALHLVDAGFRFLSNDRVLARPDGGRVDVLGYPKQPRVNPGTLLAIPACRRCSRRTSGRRWKRWMPPPGGGSSASGTWTSTRSTGEAPSRWPRRCTHSCSCGGSATARAFTWSGWPPPPRCSVSTSFARISAPSISIGRRGPW
jgi:HprK-related kinase B